MVNSTDLKNAGGTKALMQEIASRSTDPYFFSALTFLPNPDTVLRKLGKSYEVFDALTGDAHIIGELRSVRAGLLGFEWRLQAGGDAPADMRALDLCQVVMDRRPAPGLRWSDVIWNMAQSVFRGFRVHEVIWGKEGGYILPMKIVDRPERRFVFGMDNELRLLTRDNMMLGIETGSYKWLTTRHMPSFENPYGVALFSACFWPYTFKHNGFKYFVKFCDKYGIPWAVGKHPRGTPQSDIDSLVDSLAKMVEDAVGAIPDDGSVELMVPSSTGTQLPQERLIALCNGEMSKAITSQTLATEIQGQGSFAAAQTHRGREEDVNESDREVICDTFNELFAWITEINIAGAQPPTFEFYEEAQARQEWVDVLDKARNFVQIPASFAHERLQIPEPVDGEDVLPADTAASSFQPPGFSAPQRCPGCGQVHDYAAAASPINPVVERAATEADKILADMAAPIRELLDKVDTLDQFREGLVKMYPKIDETRLGELTAQALMVGALEGMHASNG